MESRFQSIKKIEAFGVGTAAVISPIERIGINGVDYFPSIHSESIYNHLKEELQKIRLGNVEDSYGWNFLI